MSDTDETHEDYRPRCGYFNHAWEITVDYGNCKEDDIFFYRGTPEEVDKELHRIFEDVVSGEITTEGIKPIVTAYCPNHDITYCVSNYK